ncbi:MAG: hypothetical protein V1875_09010 [Candidatus Altiarchaeota archaeon]
MDEITECDLGWRASGLILKIFDMFRQVTVNQVKRVLIPNGRFYLTEYNGKLESTLELLDEAGMTHHHRRMAPEEMDKTTFLRNIREKMAAGELDQKVMRPMRSDAADEASGKEIIPSPLLYHLTHIFCTFLRDT